MRTGTTLARLAHDVSGLFEGLFTAADGMRTALEPLFAAGPVTARAATDVLEPLARARLDAGLVLGCGFVPARDALADHSLYLAWWQGEDRRLLGAAGELDYTRREWFRTPVATGRRHVTGPYVDYVCTDEYVVTISRPVRSGARTLGIVGADVLVETLEDVLLEDLTAAGATLVSGRVAGPEVAGSGAAGPGRVIVSSDHRLGAGRLIDPAGGVVCGRLPLFLLSR